MLSYQYILNINQNWFFKSKCSLWSVSFSPKLIQSNFFLGLARRKYLHILLCCLLMNFLIFLKKKSRYLKNRLSCSRVNYSLLMKKQAVNLFGHLYWGNKEDLRAWGKPQSGREGEETTAMNKWTKQSDHMSNKCQSTTSPMLHVGLGLNKLLPTSSQEYEYR